MEAAFGVIKLLNSCQPGILPAAPARVLMSFAQLAGKA